MAFRTDHRAPGGKCASLRRIDGVDRFAGYEIQLLTGGQAVLRHRRDQRPGIRVAGLAKHLPCGPVFQYPPEIHHGDAVGGTAGSRVAAALRLCEIG